MKRTDIVVTCEALGPEGIQVRELRGTERISDLFAFDLVLAYLGAEPPEGASLVGADAAIAFVEDGLEVRRVTGMVAEATDLLDGEAGFCTYRVRVVPDAARLSLVQSQEIFIDTSVPSIIEGKLRQVNLDMAMRLSPAADRYPARPFVVQYQESDLAFVRRLAEHEGIGFFFEPDDGHDVMVFTDHNEGYWRGPALGVSFQPRGERQDVFRLERTSRLCPSLFGVGDYNDDTPLVDLTAFHRLETGHGGGIVEYGAFHRNPTQGARLAQVRAEEAGASSDHYSGESDLSALAAGRRILLEGHPRFDELGLLVVEVHHHATQVAAGSDGGGEIRYANSFRAIDVARPYRPPRVTPKPRIYGVTSGIVQSAPGVETRGPWIDAEGRYLVHLLFETAPGEQAASLPIRMAQTSAGANYGFHFPLRPGTEVMVSFIDGDPDRPVIVGAVHNGIAPNLVNAREATRSRIRSALGVTVEINDGE